MRNTKPNPEIDDLEIQLRNENYRYQMALRDGAASSVVDLVIQRINDLERQLGEKSGPRPEITEYFRRRDWLID